MVGALHEIKKMTIAYELIRTDLVESYLKNGWHLYGSPVYNVRHNRMFQAMILKDDD